MQAFSGRERLGVVAAGAIVLTLTAGGWAFSHNNAPATVKPSIAANAFRPSTANGTPAALELAAGANDAATPAPNAATTVVAVPTPAATGGATIFVHVAGAVKTPGVYKFNPGDRINDAVKAAGGFQSTADRDALNLADTLQDADQIYIPTADKQVATAAATNTSETGAIAGPPRMSALPAQRKSRSRRTRPLIVPGTAPASGREIHIEPLPAPIQPGDTPIQPLPTPSLGHERYRVANTVVADPVAPPRRGRVIGRITPASEPAPSDDSAPADNGDDSGDVAPAPSGVLLASRTASSGSVRKSSAGKKGAAKSGSAGKSDKFKNPGDGVVHLNSATALQMEKIPGVGPAMSARIVEYRTEIGKFTDVSQLMDVKGIGEKKFAKMQPFLML